MSDQASFQGSENVAVGTDKDHQAQPNHPITQKEHGHVSHQLVELLKIQEFISGELHRDREQFNILFKRTAWFVGVLLLLAGGAIVWLGFNTAQEVRRTARDVASQAIEEEVKVLQKTISDRIEREFDKENLKLLVEGVAVRRAKEELTPIIAKTVEAHVQSRLQIAEPTFQKLVKSEMEKRVDQKIVPLEKRLQSTVEFSNAVTTGILAVNGDRKAYEALFPMTQSPNPQIRAYADLSIRSVSQTHNQALRPTRYFKQERTREELLKFVKDPDPWYRQAAIDTLTKQWPKDSSLASVYVERIMSDDNLSVVESAFRALMDLAGEKWEVLDFQAVNNWWAANQSKFQQ